MHNNPPLPQLAFLIDLAMVITLPKGLAELPVELVVRQFLSIISPFLSFTQAVGTLSSRSFAPCQYKVTEDGWLITINEKKC